MSEKFSSGMKNINKQTNKLISNNHAEADVSVYNTIVVLWEILRKIMISGIIQAYNEA